MTPESRTPDTLSRSAKAALATALAVLFAVVTGLLFQAGPVGTAAAGAVSDDPTNELPEAEGPRVQIRNYLRGPQRLGEDRQVGVARVRCVVGTCQVSVVNSRIRVRRQAFQPTEVIAPMVQFQAGEVGKVELVVPEAAVELLGGPRRVGMAGVRVRASATLGDETVNRGRVVKRGFKLAREKPQKGDRR